MQAFGIDDWPSHLRSDWVGGQQRLWVSADSGSTWKEIPVDLEGQDRVLGSGPEQAR